MACWTRKHTGKQSIWIFHIVKFIIKNGLENDGVIKIYLIKRKELRYKTKTFLGLTFYFFPCIFISSSRKLMESLHTRKMQTLILLSNNSESMNEKELFVISKFKYLRVLKLSHCYVIHL